MVLVGLPQQVCPGLLLGAEEGLARVEAAFDKLSGHRGAVVCGFEEEAQARRILDRGYVESQWGVLAAQRAYSGRTTSKGNRTVRCWKR